MLAKVTPVCSFSPLLMKFFSYSKSILQKEKRKSCAAIVVDQKVAWELQAIYKKQLKVPIKYQVRNCMFKKSLMQKLTIALG